MENKNNKIFDNKMKSVEESKLLQKAREDALMK